MLKLAKPLTLNPCKLLLRSRICQNKKLRRLRQLYQTQRMSRKGNQTLLKKRTMQQQLLKKKMRQKKRKRGCQMCPGLKPNYVVRQFDRIAVQSFLLRVHYFGLLAHSLTHSLTHPLTHPPARAIAHSLTYPFSHLSTSHTCTYLLSLSVLHLYACLHAIYPKRAEASTRLATKLLQLLLLQYQS